MKMENVPKMKSHKILTALLLGVLAVSGFSQDRPWTSVLRTLPKRHDGAFIRLYPDQTFRLFGVGSAAYEKDADNDDMLRVEKQATMKAKAELIKFINQKLSAADSAQSAYKSAEREVSENGNTQKQSVTISQKAFASQIQSSSSMMISGIVTLEVITITKGNGGIVKALVGVSSMTQQTAAAVQGETDAPAPASPVADAPAAAAPAAPVNATTAPPKADNEWIECIGRGTDRNSAVQAALIEGVQQVYGVYLENDESVKKRFEQMKSNQTISTTKNTSQTQSTLTQSKGFIREYRIISVIQAENVQEAKVNAWIVNPRAGGIRTIMLYPMSISLDKESKNYDAGPELRLSGAEMAALCSSKFEQAFNQTNKFVVLNLDDLKKVLAQQKLTNAMVAAGKALPLEMAKMGQLLCADYIFVPEFEDINYTRKLGYDKAANKFKPQVTLRLSFKYRLIDVRTGSQIKNEDLSVMINNQDIAQLPEEGGEKTDMLRLLMNKTVSVLSQQINF